MFKSLMGLTLMVFAFTATAQPEPLVQPAADPDCRDNNGVDRCAEDQLRRMRALYGVRSIEEEGAAGNWVRRVFYVDGYGGDVLLIAFASAAVGEPSVSVRFPERDGRPPAEPLQARVPQEVWEDLLRHSELSARQLVPLPLPDNMIRVCMHSWVYVVEAADPGASNGDPPKVRRDASDRCEGRLAAWFADEVERAALRLLPPCARLDPSHHRNGAAQLAACGLLSGERMAAAEVMNRLRGLWRFPGPGDYRNARNLFARGAVVDWIGRRHGAEDGADAFWIARMREARNPIFHLDAIEGTSATRVRVTGSLHRNREAAADENSDAYRAPVEMIWVTRPGAGFQVESLSVGRWGTYEDEPQSTSTVIGRDAPAARR